MPVFKTKKNIILQKLDDAGWGDKDSPTLSAQLATANEEAKKIIHHHGQTKYTTTNPFEKVLMKSCCKPKPI